MNESSGIRSAFGGRVLVDLGMDLTDLPRGVMTVFEVQGAYREAGGGVAILGHRIHPPTSHRIAETFRVSAPEALRWSHYGKCARGQIVVVWERDDEEGKKVTRTGDRTFPGDS